MQCNASTKCTGQNFFSLTSSLCVCTLLLCSAIGNENYDFHDNDIFNKFILIENMFHSLLLCTFPIHTRFKSDWWHIFGILYVWQYSNGSISIGPFQRKQLTWLKWKCLRRDRMCILFVLIITRLMKINRICAECDQYSICTMWTWSLNISIFSHKYYNVTHTHTYETSQTVREWRRRQKEEEKKNRSKTWSNCFIPSSTARYANKFNHTITIKWI